LGWPGGADVNAITFIRNAKKMFFIDSKLQHKLAHYAPLPLRLIVGYGFMAHGLAKLMKGPDAFVAIVHAMGVPAPFFMAWLTILIELFGGLAVLLGAFVVPLSVPMAAVLLVATYSVHLPFGFTSIKLIAITASGPQFGPPGYETDLLYLACLATLVAGGSGPLAVDNQISRWLQKMRTSPMASRSVGSDRQMTGTANAVTRAERAGRRG
jgi:putative oxidoreductase